MVRKAFGVLLTLALAVAWAAPVCAESARGRHACCEGGDAPGGTPSDQSLPACCRAPAAASSFDAVAVPALSPALLPSAALSAEPPKVHRVAPARFVPASPQAPPGTHSGLSPPSSGL